jgi:hypothetical protein
MPLGVGIGRRRDACEWEAEVSSVKEVAAFRTEAKAVLTSGQRCF